ncbi:MAG: hypothetical protein ACFFCS_29405, partial [Candidatus Hodarchaeota archaeon]
MMMNEFKKIESKIDDEREKHPFLEKEGFLALLSLADAFFYMHQPNMLAEINLPLHIFIPYLNDGLNYAVDLVYKKCNFDADYMKMHDNREYEQYRDLAIDFLRLQSNYRVFIDRTHYLYAGRADVKIQDKVLVFSQKLPTLDGRRLHFKNMTQQHDRDELDSIIIKLITGLRTYFQFEHRIPTVKEYKKTVLFQIPPIIERKVSNYFKDPRFNEPGSRCRGISL